MIGSLIELRQPRESEADLLNGNKVGEIVVMPEGHVTEGPKWVLRPL
jgi:hypothetical protein